MITGDSIENALYVAKKCEIITEEEANIDGIWLTGEQFRRNYNMSINSSRSRTDLESLPELQLLTRCFL
jgi:magnesium-transporting ATPase (P-type)